MDALIDINEEILRPPWGQVGRSFTLGFISLISKFLLQTCNTVTVSDRDRFVDAVTNREQGVGLLTISNHTSTYDDPGIFSAILPWKFFYTELLHGKNRWSLCAEEICFPNFLLRQFFLNGKVLPVKRGEGVQQPIMSTAAGLLHRGDWVHVFPEGRVNFNGRVGSCRWGVGKLVCDAQKLNGGRDPLILPFYHSGMGDVLPMHSFVPRVGHRVHVSVGRPLDLSPVTCNCNQPGVDQEQVWKDITLKLKQELQALEARAPPNRDQLDGKPDPRDVARALRQRQRAAEAAAAAAAAAAAGGTAPAAVAASR